MMKVALCTEIMYPLYGVERRVYEFARRLPKYGIDVEVLTSTHKNHFKQLKLIQVSHCTITNPPKRNYAFCMNYMFNLFRQLMKRDYDLVNAEGHLSLIPCSAAAKLRKKASIATIHDLYLSQWGGMYKSAASLAGLPFEVLSCKMPFDCVLTVNSSLKKKMSSILKISEKKVQILHSGIDTQYINSVREKGKDGSIVYIGRLVPQKNIDGLIRAYAQLPREMRSHELKIIGEGSERPKLEALATSLGVNVLFTGKIESHEDVLRELKKASLFVLPSKRESFGITILEAMCCGVPVISTPTEGPSDHIKNGETGFLAGEKDLAGRMLKILSNKRLQQTMSRNGREYAAKHDWENITKNMAGVYRKVYESRH
ncbi:MAG: glycosyltransferase family 4 protein [Candidatus Aenigmarchaeota archaeon]|nr:glycosyltransferase family 4 protein [Candidatus Aenigmarchaeota archaeon]